MRLEVDNEHVELTEVDFHFTDEPPSDAFSYKLILDDPDIVVRQRDHLIQILHGNASREHVHSLFSDIRMSIGITLGRTRARYFLANVSNCVREHGGYTLYGQAVPAR